MAIRKIMTDSDPVLRCISRPITEITPHILTLVDDLVDTMHKQNGCGLAAVQVGVLRRVAVVEVEEDELFIMINPEIIASEGEQEELEGCLSLPEQWGVTRRPRKVTVRYTDRNGEAQTATGEDLLARAFCHEIDHLDGKLFTDVLVSPLSFEEEKTKKSHRKNRKK